MKNYQHFHEKIIELAKKHILYTPHAIRQMNSEKRMITTNDVEKVISGGRIIEDYPDDKRGHSCLMHAEINERHIHIVCAPKDNYVAIITAYVPDKEIWSNNFNTRIKK
ncbi:MAG: hypothetical protein A2Z20_11635 [Bdellovibrionales bacterium RBG_16_40_8]|nr:MAG: hypothetical protein A2Z20_11635 [Bdellovibrionales bacterium RBG_16_40_8]